MGMSADAKLFFGFSLDEETLEMWGEESGFNDWREFYASQCGVKKPDAEFGDESRPAYHAYWDQMRNLIAESGCDINFHCCYECMTWYVSAHEVGANQGDEFAVDLGELEQMTESLTHKLEEFCHKMTIKRQEPKWLLVTRYG